MNQDAEKSPTTPSLPQARQHAPHPELRSRFDEILNVPHGKERVLARLGRVGRVGERGYACGLVLLAASLETF